MIAFIKSGENYQFATGGHPVAAAGNHGPVVGQFGISPFHQQQTQVQFQTHRIGIDPQGNFLCFIMYDSFRMTHSVRVEYCTRAFLTV